MHHFDDLEQQKEAASLGMWVFLATEVLFFGGLFVGGVGLEGGLGEIASLAQRREIQAGLERARRLRAQLARAFGQVLEELAVAQRQRAQLLRRAVEVLDHTGAVALGRVSRLLELGAERQLLPLHSRELGALRLELPLERAGALGARRAMSAHEHADPETHERERHQRQQHRIQRHLLLAAG